MTIRMMACNVPEKKQTYLRFAASPQLLSVPIARKHRTIVKHKLKRNAIGKKTTIPVDFLEQ